ncbi:hypothetical protein [Glycomyces buryatensis]|uniref:Uncharacterized protein n=1 Tax=Glycomyces buryatensis TaxID=2570927 RepID=A0A4S8Q5S8_9ACTN|nr:hypothetical protein [Glycomyces buryatensis]THV39508.1 hypothetical protein FAB82_18040 [Glycomyces buryatensis]
MEPPRPTAPELLLRKPGTVTTAQVLMWLQFALTVCTGTVVGFVGLIVFGILPRLGSHGLDPMFSQVIAPIVTVIIVVAILYAVLANKLGAGRRWAQITTAVLMLLSIVGGAVSFNFGFKLGDSSGVPLETSGVFGSMPWLVMPVITLVCLCTGSANQWFRQGGLDPLRQGPPPTGPGQQYSPYVNG